MRKHLALLTVVSALDLLNPNSSPANSADLQHRMSQATTQAAPERPDRTHNGAVAGTVSDDKGASVSGADVMLQDTVTQEAPVTTTTNDRGQYKFASLLPGEYQVWAKKGDQQSDHLQLKVANGTIAAGDLTLRKAGAHM